MVLSKSASSIMRKGFGYRYGWPPGETDIGRVLEFEIEEVGNDAMLEDAQKVVGLSSKTSLPRTISEIRRRYGNDATAVWVTDTPRQAAWYGMGAGDEWRDIPKQEKMEILEQVDKVCVPRSAKVVSDIGKEGILFLARKRDWQTCRNGKVLRR